MRRIILIFLTFIVSFLGVSCVSIHKTHSTKLKIKKATYHSWQATNQEKGTQVEIKLLRLHPKIKIKYIIFRKHKMKPSSQKKGNGVILRGSFVHKDSKLSRYNNRINKPNGIVYEMDGKEYTYELKSIKRKAMKYHR